MDDHHRLINELSIKNLQEWGKNPNGGVQPSSIWIIHICSLWSSCPSVENHQLRTKNTVMCISLPEFSDRRFIGQLSMTSCQSEKTSRGWTSDGKWINNATLRRFTWAHWARGTRTDGTCTEGPPRCWTMPFFERWWPLNWPHNPWMLIPIGSMYAIYGNIYHKYPPNVSIYTIHGSYGIWIFTNGLRMFKVLVDRFGKVGPPFTIARCWCTTPLLYIIWLSWLIK
jgi:hypothetical protein